MIDEHAATESKWEDDNDLRCHPVERGKNLDKYLYTRMCVCLSEFFFSSLKVRKWRIVCSGSLKDHFSFRLFSTVDRQPDAQKHSYIHTLFNLTLNWLGMTHVSFFLNKNICNTNVNFIKLNWKFSFVPFMSSDLCLTGQRSGDDELTHTLNRNLSIWSVTLEIK